MTSASGPLAGEPREREPAGRSRVAWAGSWLAWWVLLLSFWIAVDDSLAVDEVLAGAGAAAIAAFVADLALYQAAVRLRVRPRWLVPALRRCAATGPATGSRRPPAGSRAAWSTTTSPGSSSAWPAWAASWHW